VQADDYEYANHWLDFKTLNPNHDDMPAALKLFLVSLLALQKDKIISPKTLKASMFRTNVVHVNVLTLTLG
jgi:hypothetical protein